MKYTYEEIKELFRQMWEMSMEAERQDAMNRQAEIDRLNDFYKKNPAAWADDFYTTKKEYGTGGSPSDGQTRKNAWFNERNWENRSQQAEWKQKYQSGKDYYHSNLLFMWNKGESKRKGFNSPANRQRLNERFMQTSQPQLGNCLIGTYIFPCVTVDIIEFTPNQR